MPALLPLIWANRRLVAEVIGIALLALIAWWFFWHNPKVIKQLTAERDQAIAQKEAAFNAINMLGEINKAHTEIDKESADNENKIRNGRKPGVRGIFVAGGVQTPVYSAYSTTGATATVDDKGAVRP